jgi:hypothetical protein
MKAAEAALGFSVPLVVGLALAALCGGCLEQRIVAGDAGGDSTASRPHGTRGGPCYPNHTCNPGLICVSGRCVRPADARAPDGRRDVGRRPDLRRPDLRRPDLRRPDARSPDAGQVRPTWTTMQSLSTADLYAVWGTGSRHVWAAGKGGTLLLYDGRKPPAFAWWNAVKSGTSRALYGIWGTAAHDLYVVGEAGTVLHGGGSSWTTLSPPTTGALVDVWGAGVSDVFTVSAQRLILHNRRDRWPPAWTPAPAGTGSQGLQGLDGASSTSAYAVGSGGLVLFHDGSAWKQMFSNSTANLLDVWDGGPTDAFAVGAGGTVLYYDGTSWKKMASGTTESLHGVWGSSPTDVHAVGTRGTILHHDGASWRLVNSGTTRTLREVWGTGPADVFAVGDQGTILHYGPCHCLVGGACLQAGDRDHTGCKVCDPSRSRTSLSAFSADCAIGGRCYAAGEKDSSGCRVCDPSRSATSWTQVKAGCSISGHCNMAGDEGPLSCLKCAPAKDQAAWSVKNNSCQISSRCYRKGDSDSSGCNICDPTRNPHAWVPLLDACKIQGKCYPNGTRHPEGCAECRTSASKTGWTLTSTSYCLVSHMCGVYCSGSCVHLKTDRNNCGKCGNVCAGTRVCDNGICKKACAVVAGFEPGTWPDTSWIQKSTPVGTTGASYAHDGKGGVVNVGWHYRTKTAFGKPGDRLWLWSRYTGSLGRVYLGFKAGSAGAWSLVMATNTSALILQENSGYGYSDKAIARVTYKANNWYKLELEFLSAGQVKGTLLDSDGATVVQTVTHTIGGSLVGGTALRVFGSHHADTVTICAN